jgi:hypothetical protein
LCSCCFQNYLFICELLHFQYDLPICESLNLSYMKFTRLCGYVDSLFSFSLNWGSFQALFLQIFFFFFFLLHVLHMCWCTQWNLTFLWAIHHFSLILFSVFFYQSIKFSLFFLLSLEIYSALLMIFKIFIKVLDNAMIFIQFSLSLSLFF